MACYKLEVWSLKDQAVSLTKDAIRFIIGNVGSGAFGA